MREEGEKVERESESEACGRGPAMDTPDRNRIAAPVAKIEDSPVFNYINSLSPIKIVKSIRISQTFNSFNFSSPPPIFTSPHASSIRESRFLRRHILSDSSKPEFSAENGNKAGSDEQVIDVAHNSDEQQENFDPGSFIGEATAEQTHECSKLSTEVPETQNFDYGSPECSAMPCLDETNRASELAGTSGQVVQFAQEVTAGFVGSGMRSERRKIEQNKEGTGCDWDSMVPDASDLFIFDSPNVSEAFRSPFQKQLDPGMRLCTSLVSEFTELTHDEINDLPKAQAVGPVGVQHHNLESPSFQVGGHLRDIEKTGDILVDSSLNEQADKEPGERTDNEPISNLHRGMRRRCLVFEMAGARRKHLDDSSSSGSSALSHSNINIESKDKQPLLVKPRNDSSRCIVPGIGLHLNALARTSKEYNAETLASLRPLTNEPSPPSPFLSLPTGQESLNKALVVASLESKSPPEIEVQGTEDIAQASGCIASEDFNPGSPKKKKRRLENTMEEGCKRCNCKKSKCLKLYCECFAAGVYCVEPCSCQDCFNKPIHEDTVLATRKQIESRNPLAFAPKVIRATDSLPETGDESSKTPASARHKRGCNCKKSGCLKKYCECYQGGVGCSINCRCEGCKNAFGRKDVLTSVGVEAEPEEEETEICEKSIVDKSLQKNLIQSSADLNTDSALLATPMRSVRTVQPPFASRGKPPRSSFLSIGSSSGHFGSRLGKPSFLLPQPESDKCSQTVQEDEMPEILQGNSSPISGIKSASPNSKRVSPPHCDFSSSPGRKSTRKLILQSIPSFPSLTPNR